MALTSSSREIQTSVLRLDNLALETDGQPLNARVVTGQIAVFVLNREELCTELVNAVLGFNLNQTGSVSLFDQTLTPLTEKERVLILQRMGIVSPGLGLIANLNVLENLLLAVNYHAIDERAENRQRAQRLLEFVDYRQSPYLATGKLSFYQQKQVSLVRALMFKPDLLIYASFFEGLSFRESEKLLDLTREIHLRKQGRTSIFLTTDHHFVARLPAETQVFRLQAEG